MLRLFVMKTIIITENKNEPSEHVQTRTIRKCTNPNHQTMNKQQFRNCTTRFIHVAENVQSKRAQKADLEKQWDPSRAPDLSGPPSSRAPALARTPSWDTTAGLLTQKVKKCSSPSDFVQWCVNASAPFCSLGILMCDTLPRDVYS